MNYFKENVFIDLLTTCQLVKKMYSELEKKYYINFIQLAIIFLSGTRNMTVSNLAEELNVSKSAISQALVKLFIMKYVTKVAADENKKSFYILPVKKGITIKEEMMALIKKRNGEIEKLMGTENANQFGLLLETLNETLESINNEGGK